MIIPDSVIKGWLDHYEADAALAAQYPERPFKFPAQGGGRF